MSKARIQKLIADLQAKKYREGEAKGLMSTIQQEQTKALQPVLEAMAQKIGEDAKSAIEKAIANIKVEIPKIEIPPLDVRYPEIPAPIVNVAAPNVKVQPSQVQFPEFPKFPEFKWPERMNVLMDGVDNKRPLPVMMMDLQGRPMQFPVGASGGKADFLTIKGFSQSAFAELQNPDGRLKVEMPSGSSGLTDTELRATSVPVEQVSGSSWSVYVKEVFGSTATDIINPDGRLKVELPTGSSGLTDTELRATQLQVQQVSGYADSVYVLGAAASTFAEMMNPDGRVKVELPTGSSGLTDTELRAVSLPVEQVSGSAWSVYATGFGASVGVTILNGEGLARDTWNINTVTGITNSVAVVNLDRDGNPQAAWLVSDVTASIKASLVDSSGIQYSGSNPVPVTLAVSNATSTINAVLVDSAGAYRGTLPVAVVAGSAAIGSVTVNGSLNSVIAVGATLHGVADPGAAPQKVGGVVMTANPTAEVGGDITNFRADDIGRQLVRNIQVRDLIRTAYVSVTNGTETTLRAAVAGAFLDLIMIVGSNNSDAAVSVDIRPVTAGNIINTLRIPANGTAGWTPPVPWPQSEQGNNWTVDGPDETGRTLTFSALFSQEV